MDTELISTVLVIACVLIALWVLSKVYLGRALSLAMMEVYTRLPHGQLLVEEAVEIIVSMQTPYVRRILDSRILALEFRLLEYQFRGRGVTRRESWERFIALELILWVMLRTNFIQLTREELTQEEVRSLAWRFSRLPDWCRDRYEYFLELKADVEVAEVYDQTLEGMEIPVTTIDESGRECTYIIGENTIRLPVDYINKIPRGKIRRDRGGEPENGILVPSLT